ncbi:MAG: hypothetical protein LUC98_10655, partial [Lachnospiraceae bacterium]|nr:hypothetical protein [Lachnospiraceae bacterium]
EDLFKALFNYQGSSAVRSLKGSDQAIVSNASVSVKNFFILFQLPDRALDTLASPFSEPARL